MQQILAELDYYNCEKCDFVYQFNEPVKGLIILDQGTLVEYFPEEIDPSPLLIPRDGGISPYEKIHGATECIFKLDKRVKN